MPGAERVRAIEVAAADALPCRVPVEDDGWRLRSNDGVTRRCNSVFPERGGRNPLDAKIERSEACYRSHGCVPRFQLTDASLPTAFRRRGAGGRIVRAAAERGRERGARHAYLQVHPGNVGAQAL